MASKVKDAVVWYQKKVRCCTFLEFSHWIVFCMSHNKKKLYENVCGVLVVFCCVFSAKKFKLHEKFKWITGG